jgi:hypothetical protein
MARVVGMVTVLLAAALISCGTQQSPQEDVDTAGQAVDRYISALGGRERLESLRTVHTKDSIRMAGLPGTVESWYTRSPFRGRTVVEVGPVHQQVLMLGDSVWSVDRNGRITAGDPQARAEAEMARLTMFYDVFLDPEGRISLAGDTTIAGEEAVGLRVDCEQPFTVYLSREDWLPVLQSTEIMGMRALSYPSGYREVDGLMVPDGTRDTLPAMGQAIVTSNILTELDRPVPDSVFSLAPGEVDWELAESGEPFPFMLSGEHIYIDGTVAGREATYLLDSGAGATVIDSVLAGELGLEPVGEFAAQGVGGTSSFSFVEVPEYRLGPAVIRDQKLAVMSLDLRFYPSTGVHIGMVVGYDLLSRFVTMIDYGAERMALYDPDGFHYDGDGRELPVEQSMSLLSFDAVLEDSIPVRLLLDTGAGGSLHLTPSFFESNPGFLEDRRVLQTTVEGVGGEDTAAVFRAGELKIAGYSVPAGLCSRFPGTAALEEYDGIAGTRVLARFRLWLDYDRQRVILEPSALFEEGLPEDFTGFGVRIREGELVVNRVLEGSPAARAGLAEGDVLVSLQGVAMGPSNLDTLNRLLPHSPGRSVDLEVSRDGTLRRLTLESAPILPLDRP